MEHIKYTKVKRPLNPFMVYLRNIRNQIMYENPGINQREIVKICSEMWIKETDDIKSIYKKYSSILKSNHYKKYPDYKYNPIRKNKIIRKYKKKDKNEYINNNYSFTNDIYLEYYKNDYIFVKDILSPDLFI